MRPDSRSRIRLRTATCRPGHTVLSPETETHARFAPTLRSPRRLFYSYRDTAPVDCPSSVRRLFRAVPKPVGDRTAVVASRCRGGLPKPSSSRWEDHREYHWAFPLSK